MRKAIQFLALGVLLIGAPLGSWYYLNMGYNERKAALDQLKDYGKYELIPTNDHQGRTITNDSLQQRFSVIGFTDKMTVEAPILKHTKILYDQFGKDGGIALLTYAIGADSMSLERYSKAQLGEEPGHWYILGVDAKRYDNERDKVLGDSLKNGNYFALVDTTLTIRSYYDATDLRAVNELAKHIAMFIAPTKARPDLVFQRKKEK